MNAIDMLTVSGAEQDILFHSAVAASPSPATGAKKTSERSTAEHRSEPISKLSERELADHLRQMIDEIRLRYEIRSTSLNFSIDRGTDSLIVKVMDSSNDRLIRQIPPDEMLALRRRMQAFIGMLLDKEA